MCISKRGYFFYQFECFVPITLAGGGGIRHQPAQLIQLILECRPTASNYLVLFRHEKYEVKIVNINEFRVANNDINQNNRLSNH